MLVITSKHCDESGHHEDTPAVQETSMVTSLRKPREMLLAVQGEDTSQHHLFRGDGIKPSWLQRSTTDEEQ